MNQRWVMQFMSDALSNGDKLRVFTVVDAFTRECVVLDVAAHFRGEDVARILTRAAAERGKPAVIGCDNGTEFTSRVFDQWAWTNGVQLDFSRPGKPTDNATSESFNASVDVSAFRNITFRLSPRQKSSCGRTVRSTTSSDHTAVWDSRPRPNSVPGWPPTWTPESLQNEWLSGPGLG